MRPILDDSLTANEKKRKRIKGVGNNSYLKKNIYGYNNYMKKCYLGAVGLGDPVPGDLHGHLHALRGRLPPQRARLRNPSHGTR